MMRARTQGNSPTAIQHLLTELHSESWLEKTVTYMSDCRRYSKYPMQFGRQVEGPCKEPAPYRHPPKAGWFLSTHVMDVYERLDVIKSSCTSVFGSILKVDSTKKILRKLSGKFTGTANWVTSVGNERGEILLSIVTTSESKATLQEMAEGLTKRFSDAAVDPPCLLYTDRDCCAQGRLSKYQDLFNQWDGLLVRLDIWHFMRRLAAGCTTESHPLYGPFMSELSSCIFAWDSSDVGLLKLAKQGEIRRLSGVQNPSDVAVMKAISKSEIQRHCRKKTRGAVESIALIDRLISTFQSLTDMLGVPILRDEMSAIWNEQKKHVPCIQDPPGVQLYTLTGIINKGGVNLSVYRCGRGSTSLESFHLHLNRFIPGTSASGANFQAYLLEGITRWNADRRDAAYDWPEPPTLRTYNVALQDAANQLSIPVLNKPLLPTFRAPGKYTGEKIGIEYLVAQTDVALPTFVESLITEVDEGISSDTELLEEPDSIEEDPELEFEHVPDQGEEYMSHTTVDASGLPGWDKVDKLAAVLVDLEGQAVPDNVCQEIVSLWGNLNVGDKRPLRFVPNFPVTSGTGRFRRTKRRSHHVGAQSAARTFTSGGEVAFSPSCSRVMSAIFMRLCDRHMSPTRASAGQHYLSQWKTVVNKYNELRRSLLNSPVHDQTDMQLLPVNETTVIKWYKDQTRLATNKTLLQGSAYPSMKTLSEDALPTFLRRPASPVQQAPTTMQLPQPPDTVGLAASRRRTAVHPGSSSTSQDISEDAPAAKYVSRTTAYRHRKRQEAADKELASQLGLPEPAVPTRRRYACGKCGLAATKLTGHSQFYGHMYCPNQPGQIPLEEWLATKRAERRADKAAEAAAKAAAVAAPSTSG
uniref:Uncharacterized protein LOC100184639 n=1 Tax=Phallusia mammillata TaxID=59560 RepID=A0A6F9DHE2_9ASCI|nr:uncharacterized protein LOC100184639 [Phallusia mammillata]